MMKIEYHKGDILRLHPEEVPILAYGVNCRGAMGAGFAAIIRRHMPHAYDDYVGRCSNNFPEDLLGTVLVSDPYPRINHTLRIAHLFTQLDYGNDRRRRYVDYGAVGNSIAALNRYIRKNGDEGIRVVMPKIGAGLGRGDWKKISKAIETNSTHFQPVVYELEEHDTNNTPRRGRARQ